MERLTAQALACLFLLFTPVAEAAFKQDIERYWQLIKKQPLSACSSIERSILLDWENDSPYSDSDRYYTNGIRLRLERTDSAQYTEHEGSHISPSCANTPDENPKLEEGRRASYTAGVALGNTMYTASDITREFDTFSGDERPYAGYLWLSFYGGKSFSTDEEVNIEMQIGCTGKCSRAEELQKEWHELVGAARPVAWDSQIAEEPVVQFLYRRYLPVTSRLSGESSRGHQFRRWDLRPFYGLDLGNFSTKGYGGFTLRHSFYRMRSYFEGIGDPGNIKSAFLPVEINNNDNSADELNKNRKHKGIEAFAYLNLNLSAIAHSTPIDGGLINDSEFTQNSRDFVSYAQFGLAVRVNRFHVVLSRNFRSTEYEARRFDLLETRWTQLQISAPY